MSHKTKLILSISSAAVVVFTAAVIITSNALIARRDSEAISYISGNYGAYVKEQADSAALCPVLGQMLAGAEVVSAQMNNKKDAIDVCFTLPRPNILSAARNIEPYNADDIDADPLGFLSIVEKEYAAVSGTPHKHYYFLSLPLSKKQHFSIEVDFLQQDVSDIVREYCSDFSMELEAMLAMVNAGEALSDCLLADPSAVSLKLGTGDYGRVHITLEGSGIPELINYPPQESYFIGIGSAVSDTQKIKEASLLSHYYAPLAKTTETAPADAGTPDAGNALSVDTPPALPYLIYVSKNSFTIAILGIDRSGEYTQLLHTFHTAVGRTNAQTRAGTYEITSRERWHSWGTTYSPYATRHSGGLWFHGPIYTKKDPETLKASSYNEIGTKATSGCMRTYTSAAAWIYGNCPDGTPVIIANDSKYTSSPPAKIGSSQKYDPTDPDIIAGSAGETDDPDAFYTS